MKKTKIKRILSSILIGTSAITLGACSFSEIMPQLGKSEPSIIENNSSTNMKESSVVNFVSESIPSYSEETPSISTYNPSESSNIISPSNYGLEFYSLDGGTYGVTVNYNQNLSKIEIPSTYQGKKVTAIMDGAFYEYRNLTSITIPDSITSIGNKAFYKCGGLTNISIPNSVTSIGYEAFVECDGLKSITIPNGVTCIESYTFSGCSGLTSITIPSSVTNIGQSALRYCSSLTSITFNGTEEQWNSINKEWEWDLGTGKYTITYSPTFSKGLDIRDGILYGMGTCNDLNVVIPDGVTSIGNSAF